MRVNPRTTKTLKHKKRVIKWENILIIPLIIFNVIGIIKVKPQFITIAIVQDIIVLISTYCLVRTIRIKLQRKGLLKSIKDFINLK